MKPPRQSAVPFILRPGIDPIGQAGWRGMNTESDPGSLDPNELVLATNVRLRGRNIRTRPGMTVVCKMRDFAEHYAAFAGITPVTWMKEAPIDNPRTRLWASALGCFGAAVGTGSMLFHIDPSQSPLKQDFNYYSAVADRQTPMGKYGEALYIGDGGTLRKVELVTSLTGVTARSIIGSPTSEPIHTFSGFNIRCLFEFDGKLFIGLENLTTPGSSKIAVWDGLELQDNDLTGVRPPLAMGTWRNKLVVGFDATAAYIRVRDPGDSPGTWTNVALAGFLCASQGNAICEVRDKTYIASGTNLIHAFNGTALSLVRTVGTAATDGYGVTALTSFQGLLHYGWNTAAGAPGYSASIGRHDPDSTANEWVDSYKAVTASQANFIKLSSMLSYRRQIYCGGRYMWVVATAPNDVQGTVQVVYNNGAPGLGFEILQMLRFP